MYDHDNNERRIEALMVCFDQAVLHSEKRCLELQGDIEVDTASSEEEAKVKVKKNRPDAIVVDLSGIPSGFPLNAHCLLENLRSVGNQTPLVLFGFENERDLFAEVGNSKRTGFVEKYGAPSVVYSSLKGCILSLLSNCHGEENANFARGEICNSQIHQPSNQKLTRNGQSLDEE